MLRRLAAVLAVAASVLSAAAWSGATAQGQAAAPGVGPPPPPAATLEADLPRKLLEYGDWQALVAGSGEDRACYVTLKVLPSPTDGRARDRPLLYVTHRPGRQAPGVVSYFAGYTLQPGSDVEMDFGFARFRLFTHAATNSAWAPSAEIDARIVEAMKAGYTVTVRGVDAADREVGDTFSLMGFTAAFIWATRECQPR